MRKTRRCVHQSTSSKCARLLNHKNWVTPRISSDVCVAAEVPRGRPPREVARASRRRACAACKLCPAQGASSSSSSSPAAADGAPPHRVCKRDDAENGALIQWCSRPGLSSRPFIASPALWSFTASTSIRFEGGVYVRSKQVAVKEKTRRDLLGANALLLRFNLLSVRLWERNLAAVIAFGQGTISGAIFVNAQRLPQFIQD